MKDHPIPIVLTVLALAVATAAAQCFNTCRSASVDENANCDPYDASACSSYVVYTPDCTKCINTQYYVGQTCCEDESYPSYAQVYLSGTCAGGMCTRGQPYGDPVPETCYYSSDYPC